MGPWEEEDPYAKEVFALVDSLKPKDLIFTGRINVTEYLGRMDATILSSISEDTMSVAGLSDAMVQLARNPELAKSMGEIGYKRLMSKYQLSQMKETYRNLYKKMAKLSNCAWSEDKFIREDIREERLREERKAQSQAQKQDA